MSTKTNGSINIDIDPVIKARLLAECEVRSENDHVPWNYRRLMTEFALRILRPLSEEDEERIVERSAALCNGHQPTPGRGVEGKHKRQKVKPAA